MAVTDPTGYLSIPPELIRGVSWKQPCRVATTANITISTALNNGDTLDGVTLATGDRVLVKDQSTGSQNGIYVVGATPSRGFDMDQDLTTAVPAHEVLGAVIIVIAGTTNGGTLWRNTNTTEPTLGTTALTFAQITATSTASAVSITDSGGYFTATDVEAALQELAKKDIGYTAHGNTGSTETFDALTGWHSATLDANCMFTFTGATSGLVAAMVLELAQDGTGSRLVTWPGSVVWPGGTAPTLSTAAGAVDILTMFSRDGGATWYGFPSGGSGISFGTPAVVLGTAAAAGSASTAIRTDATIVAFDTTAPVTQAFGDTAATGLVAKAARRDHVHGMPAAPTGGSDHEHIANVVFSGDGSTTVWELPAAPIDETGIAVYITGSRSIGWTLSGTLLTTLTFDSAPASAANNIVIDIEAAVA